MANVVNFQFSIFSPPFRLEQLSKVTEGCVFKTFPKATTTTTTTWHVMAIWIFFIGGEGGPSAKKRAQVKKHEGIKAIGFSVRLVGCFFLGGGMFWR